MELELTEEQVDLLAKLEQTGFVVTEAEVNDGQEPEEAIDEDAELSELSNKNAAADESINKLYSDVVDQLDAEIENQDEQEDEDEPIEKITIECSSCNVILSIDQVILNTLEPEGKLAISSVDNLLKLAEVRDMYMRY